MKKVILIISVTTILTMVITKSSADFFSFSAANDSAGAYKGVVLILQILCDPAHTTYVKEESTAAHRACEEFNKK